jgi:VIT1/CCC1 family predicted Fe2+/Mn2+ transporter
MKKAAAMLSTLVLGCATGFFGVFLSVFSYGAAKERIVTVGVILLIYIALGVVLGLIWPILK